MKQSDPFDFSRPSPVRATPRPARRKAGLPTVAIVGLVVVGVWLLVALRIVAVAVMGRLFAAAPHPAPQTAYEMSLTAYAADTPDRPVRFTVNAKLETFIDPFGPFGGMEKTSYAVDLDEGTEDMLTAVLPKDSPDGRRAFAALKDGRWHGVTVEVENVGPDGQRLKTVAGGVLLRHFLAP